MRESYLVILFLLSFTLTLVGCATYRIHTDVPKQAFAKFERVKILTTEPIQPYVMFHKFTTVEQVHTYVNASPYKPDDELYGKDDYWATPYEFLMNGGGDCEDYAITKYFLILENGLATEEEMEILLVYDNKNNGFHAILKVRDMILDNQRKLVIKDSDPWLKKYVVFARIRK